MSFIKISNPNGGPLTMEQRRELAKLMQKVIDAEGNGQDSEEEQVSYEQGIDPDGIAVPDDSGDWFTVGEIMELRKATLRCHFDQKAKVHYVGIFDDGGGAAPRMALTMHKLVRWALAEGWKL